MADVIISCKEARSQGLKHYFTGKPCVKGHIAKRLVSSRCCMKCATEKSLTAYHADIDAGRKKALKSYYANKEARAAYARRYRAKNIDLVTARDKKSYAANRQKRIEKCREWKKANPDKIQQYNEANRERRRETIAAWFAANPDKRRAYVRNRYALKKAAEGTFDDADLQRIYAAQKGKCACCSKKMGDVWQVDHITPLARGGSNWPRNLQITCPECNQRKNARDPLDHARSLGLLL